MNLFNFAYAGTQKLVLDRPTIEAWRDIIDQHRNLKETDRDGFRFSALTDGFVGREYSTDPSRPDLCERFCYWHANVKKHRTFQFSTHPFYEAVQRYENQISRQAELVYDQVKSQFRRSTKSFSRDHSYVQICSYHEGLSEKGRIFLQDPHEDGHLFTIAKPTQSGLVILDGGRFVEVELAPNEAIVMAGSLLTSLTEELIQPAIHAVKRTCAGNDRLSVLYFVNPDPARESQTWISGRPVDIGAQMRARHAEFGNSPLTGKFPEKGGSR